MYTLGQMTKAEKKYLAANLDKPIEVIRKHVNRSDVWIKNRLKDIRQENLLALNTFTPFEETQLYKSIRPEKRDSVKLAYNQILQQFGDVTQTDLMMICDFLAIQLLIDTAYEEIHKLNCRKDEYAEKLKQALLDQNRETIADCEREIAAIHAQQSNLVDEIVRKTKIKSDLMKSLKAQRVQRHDLVDKGNENFPDWLRELHREHISKKITEHIRKEKTDEKWRLLPYGNYENIKPISDIDETDIESFREFEKVAKEHLGNRFVDWLRFKLHVLNDDLG